MAEQPDPAQVGIWLQIVFWVCGGFAAMVATAVGIKKLLEPKALKDLPATRNELDAEVARLETRIERLQEDAKQRHHDVKNALGPIRLKLERIDIFIGMLTKKAGIDLPMPSGQQQTDDITTT